MKGQFIYKIINTVNGKFYVGSTIDTRERFRTHRKRLRTGKHHCAHLQAAWNKYGETTFAFVIIEKIPPHESLEAAEDRWLIEHVGKSYCYNAGTRSNAPWRGVPKEQHPRFGRARSDEEREAISQSLREFYAADITNHPRFGKTHSEESRAKISATKRANPSKPWLGKERSDETKQKISEAQKGKPKGPRVYTPEGLEKARENMRRHAKKVEMLKFDDVKAKFPAEVLEKYNFDNAVYTGALNRIEGCVCPEHGVFSQYAAQFRKGRGCPMCGGVQRAQSKSKQMKEEWARKLLDTPQNKAYTDVIPGKSGAFDSPG